MQDSSEAINIFSEERGTRLSRLKRTLRMMLLIWDAGTARIRAEFSR